MFNAFLSGGKGLLVPSAAICQGHNFDRGSGRNTVSNARSKPSGPSSSRSMGRAPRRATARAEAGHDPQLQRDLEGSNGNDKIIGDSGNNTLFGQLGADSFLGDGQQRPDRSERRQKDKVFDCGPGHDLEASVDQVDPQPQSC